MPVISSAKLSGNIVFLYNLKGTVIGFLLRICEMKEVKLLLFNYFCSFRALVFARRSIRMCRGITVMLNVILAKHALWLFGL